MSSPRKLVFPEGLLILRHDKVAAELGRLIEENHKQNGLLYKEVLHNHIQHGLLAAYCLGTGCAGLREIFSEEIKELGPLQKSKHEEIMTEYTLNEKLGRREYELDFIAYFEQQQSDSGLSMQEVLQYWLLDREIKFLPGFVGGYGHPLILFADSVELGSSLLALDALALTATDWGPLTSLITTNLPETQDYPKSLMEILDAIRNDAAFDQLVTSFGIEHIAEILHHEPAAAAISKYLAIGNAYLLRPAFNLQVTEEMVEMAIHLLMSTYAPGDLAFDFYLNHNLTLVNCLRILLPVFEHIDAKKTLLRTYWLLTIFAFVTQGRPSFDMEWVETWDTSASPTTWDEIKSSALNPIGTNNPRRIFDAHFLKAVQIMQTFGLVMAELESLLLAAACKFVQKFDNLNGFGDS